MIFAWYEFADQVNTVDRSFRVYGTGHAIPDDATYVGTALVSSGILVWHLYERSAPS
jgi:hypothetical protein